MRLTEIPAALLEETVRTWRRRIVAGVVVLIFALAAVGETISALRLALHYAVGPVGARLILAGIFLLVVAAAVLILLRAERQEAAERAAADKPFGGEAQVSAIAEAIHLGYSLAKDFRRRPPSDPPPSDAGAGPDGPPPDGDPPPNPASVRDRP